MDTRYHRCNIKFYQLFQTSSDGESLFEILSGEFAFRGCLCFEKGANCFDYLNENL